MNNKAIRRYFLLIAFVFSSGLVFYFSFTAPASAQFLLRERFTSDLHGWTSSGGAVVWQSAGTVDSYYQPDGDIGSALWTGYGILASPSAAWDDISIGSGSNYTLHFDWYWTGEPFTITHGSVVGTGLNCYGSDWPPPFDYFVVNKWNSCYLEFSGVGNTHSATRIEATSGAIDAIQRFWLLPPAGGNDGVVGENDANGTAVPITVTVTPIPTSTPSVSVCSWWEEDYAPTWTRSGHELFEGWVVNDGQGGFAIPGRVKEAWNNIGIDLQYSNDLPANPDWVAITFNASAAMWSSPATTYRISGSGSPSWQYMPSNGRNLLVQSGYESLFNYADFDKYQVNDGFSGSYRFSIHRTKYSELPDVISPNPNIIFSDIRYIMSDGSTCGYEPPPPPLPPLGFGHNCTFTPTVGISGTITTTAPVTVSSSLLVDGGFENGENGFRLYGADSFVSEASGPDTTAPFSGLRSYVAYHNLASILPIYLCVEAYVPPGTDVLEFGGAFKSTYIGGEIGFGINQGTHQALVYTPHFLDWFYTSERINAGGQSVVNVCVDYASSGGEQDVSAFDDLSLYALDRPDGVSADDFDNLELICPDPDLVEEAGGVDVPLPTATPDIWGNVTPIPTAVVTGGIPPIEIPVGVTPHPTICPVYWDEREYTHPISATVPEFGVCFEPYEIDLSGVDNVVPLPFSFMNTTLVLLNAAIAFLIIGLVKNR